MNQDERKKEIDEEFEAIRAEMRLRSSKAWRHLARAAVLLGAIAGAVWLECSGIHGMWPWATVIFLAGAFTDLD